MFAIGCSGGLIPDVLRIVKERYKDELPNYLWGLNFWIGLVLLALIGGLAAIIGEASDWKHALALGYAGPELLSRAFAGGAVALSSKRIAPVMRRWWAF